MTNRLTWQGLFACAALGVLWSLPGIAASESRPAGAATVFVMVAGKGSGLVDLSLGVVRRTYDGDPTRAGGVRLIPFNYPPDHPLRQRFDRLVLELRPAQVARYWIDRRIRGEGSPPRTLPSPEVLKAVVGRLPGAIGYLPVESLDDSVVALSIDGRRHTDPQYALRATLSDDD